MARVIAAAVKAGYKHIDTAKVYGTEPLMGPVLAKMIADGELKREDLYITCKVWVIQKYIDRPAQFFDPSTQWSLYICMHVVPTFQHFFAHFYI